MYRILYSVKVSGSVSPTATSIPCRPKPSITSVDSQMLYESLSAAFQPRPSVTPATCGGMGKAKSVNSTASVGSRPAAFMSASEPMPTVRSSLSPE